MKQLSKINMKEKTIIIRCPNCDATRAEFPTRLTNGNEKKKCSQCQKYAYVKLWKVGFKTN